MKRKIKFPLVMDNEVEVRSIEELRENFNMDKVLQYLLNGKLKIWLKDRGYKSELDQISKLEEDYKKLADELCKYIGVDYEKYKVDANIEEIKNKNNQFDEVEVDKNNDELIERSVSILKEDISWKSKDIENLSISNELKTNIKQDKFKVTYRKSVVECGGNITVIESNGKVNMLNGSPYDKEYMPKFDSPIVDIDDRIALDESGKVYQWGPLCKTIPFNLPKVKQVSTCSNIKIALDEFGVIHNWGTILFSDIFKNMPQIDSKIIQVVAKGVSVAALDEFGKVYCWGSGNKSSYNIPSNLPYIKKVQIIDNGSLFVLDKDGKVHFVGDTPSDIAVPHMLPMIVDITVSEDGNRCIALDENGKVHSLNQYSPYYKFKDIDGIKCLTPYGGIDQEGRLHEYIERSLRMRTKSYSDIKVRIPSE